jgi:hypothetical protein
MLPDELIGSAPELDTETIREQLLDAPDSHASQYFKPRAGYRAAKLDGYQKGVQKLRTRRRLALQELELFEPLELLEPLEPCYDPPGAGLA